MNSTILFKQLLSNPSYFTKVFGTIQKSDFSSVEEGVIIETIGYLYDKYKKQPSLDEITLFLDSSNKLPIKLRAITIDKLNHIRDDKTTSLNEDILIDSTENYIKRVRTELMLERGIKILEGGSKDSIEQIQQDMKDISQLSFQSSLGHDYFLDSKARFLEYSMIEETSIPSGIDLLTIAGFGGRKRLSLYLGASNSGKTLNLASFATNASIHGYNVAVMTMEDGETAWSSRIDANLMSTTLGNMKDKGVAMQTTFNSVISDSMGRIKVKEYPTGNASVNNFKTTLQEWQLRDGFIPDVLICDYLGIMKAVGVEPGNGYEKGKRVAEDLRGLAVELKIAVVSAVQAGRCLSLDTILIKDSGELILIKDVEVGDKILSNKEYVEVLYKTIPVKQKTYKITLKSGKTIICSSKHVFPSNKGELSIQNGLSVGSILHSL